jgi:SAM-dependent methyltransferase
MPELGKSIISYSTGAAAYDRMMQPWSRVYVPKLMGAVGIGLGERVLDVGTGTGATVLMAADRVGPRGLVVGVDISLPMLRIAQPKVASNAISWMAMDGQALALRDGSFERSHVPAWSDVLPGSLARPRGVSPCLASVWSRRPAVLSRPVGFPYGAVFEALAGRVASERDALLLGFSLGDGNALRAAACPALRTGRRERGFERFTLDPTVPLTSVTGGALGAHRVNRVVGAALGPLLALTQLVHQCGDNVQRDLAWLREEAARLPPALGARYRVLALVGEELGDLYAAASLVVGRAGAGTVTELAALGLPAILVPLPGARGDEQTANARVLADAGAAVLLPEAELTSERLVREVSALLADPGRLRTMARHARALATPDAAERLVDLVLALARRA